MHIEATTGVDVVHFHNLEGNHNATRDCTNSLQQELVATQAEVRELRDRQMVHERRMFELERQLSKSKVGSSRT